MLKDYLIRAMTTNKEIRALVVKATEVVEDARTAHNTTPVATAALGRTLSAGLLMGSMVKSGEQTGIRIIGDGPLEKIIVEANQYGEVRGYVGNPDIDFLTNEKGKLDVPRAIGKGQLYVKKKIGLKDPYEGNVPLVSGEIGDDITYYYTKSEQKPSAVGLGVLINKDTTVNSAGGFIIQLMPEPSEETIERLEKNLEGINSVSRLIEKGDSPEDILERLLEGFDYRILKKQDVKYKCKCNRERTKSLLAGLGEDEVKEILKKEEYVEIKCHFCGEIYVFNEEEVEEVISRKEA